MKGGKVMTEEAKTFTVAGYNQHLCEKRLMGSKCSKCGSLYAPPRPICPECHSAAGMEWVEYSGKGKLAAFTSISVAPTFMAAQGLGKNNPYVCGVVQLEEGPKITGRILGVDGKKPESIKVGTQVRMEILERAEGEGKVYTLAFKPAASA